MNRAADWQWVLSGGRSLLRFASAVLLALGTATGAWAGETPPDEPVQATSPAGSTMLAEASFAARGARCGSVVVRHCRRPMVDKAAPGEWEMVQFAGPDSDEIVVNGQRIRDPGIREVFNRAFGSPLAASGMHTRVAGAGARCTSLEATGATLCSNGGNKLPALENPLTDWTF